MIEMLHCIWLRVVHWIDSPPPRLDSSMIPRIEVLPSWIRWMTHNQRLQLMVLAELPWLRSTTSRVGSLPLASSFGQRYVDRIVIWMLASAQDHMTIRITLSLQQGNSPC